ncbi:hypothetical protein RN001_002901 [Aquatica leii]|uniref:Uncharacterized protein n=1 Tax=Aquatica leii TaxID=1421715 RepID=A0AAN7PE67_9COLE|nr:hypothetical protein RN001_002901 [Aquatica leii]
MKRYPDKLWEVTAVAIVGYYEIDGLRGHEDLSISLPNRHTHTKDSFNIPATTLVHMSSTEENLMSVSETNLVETRSNNDTIDAASPITSVAEIVFPTVINWSTHSNHSSGARFSPSSPSDSFTTLYSLDATTSTNKINENKTLEMLSETSVDMSFENDIVSVTEANTQYDNHDYQFSTLSMDGSPCNDLLIINNEDAHNSPNNHLEDCNTALPDTLISVVVDTLQNETNHCIQFEGSKVRCLKRKKSIPLTYDRNVVVTPSHILNNRQVPDNIPVSFASTSNSRKYFCIYCNKLYAKFPQHLQTSHRNEPAVNMYMLLPKKSVERRKIIETIRRRGDFVHNTFADFNSGELFVARRSKSQFERDSKHYLPCPHCAAFFNKDTLRLHAKHCIPAKVTGQRNLLSKSRSLVCKIHPRASEFLKTKIFSILRDDDCVNIIRYDLLVILYGNYMCNKYSFQHHHDMIRNKLRSIGRLLIAAKQLDFTIIDFASMLTPEKFDITIVSIKQVGGINAANTHYKAPTTVLTLSTVCKQACNIWKTECIKCSNSIGKQKVEDFLVLFNVTFPAELGRTAIENRIEQQRHKVVQLPTKDDIIKLVSFLRLKRREWFLKVRNGEVQNLKYAVQQLASYTLVSLMVFNRRRPGELERITLSDFANLQSASTISALGGHFKENQEEILLANRYKRFEIRGKLNRTVPVLVDFEIEACISLIIKNRVKIGISSTNPYVFACQSGDHRHKYLRACFF